MRSMRQVVLGILVLSAGLSLAGCAADEGPAVRDTQATPVRTVGWTGDWPAMNRSRSGSIRDHEPSYR
jgi:hypothetical protein